MSGMGQAGRREGQHADIQNLPNEPGYLERVLWVRDFPCGIHPALQSGRSVSRGDHQAEAIREMYAKWQKRVEKEGFTFKGLVMY